MRKTVRDRLTYANVVATLALFIAVGGASAFAATQLGKNSVGTKQLKSGAVTTAKIKNGAVTGAKVKVSSLGTVPNASHADSAANAGALGGAAPSSYAKSGLEAVNVVGAPGQPTFEHGCSSNNLAGQVGFYKDGFGIVHLTGSTQGCTEGNSMFTLPAGFRPAAITYVGVARSETLSSELRIDTNGRVEVYGGGSPATPRLDGVTFRAAS